MADESTKTFWPGWETVRMIGRGSFGAVYEIQRRIFDDTEKSALKVISIPQNDSEIDEMLYDGYDEANIINAFHDQLKSIVAEYTLMRKLSENPNIVRCDDVRYTQQANGFGWDIFIKMELLTPLMRALPQVIPEETVIKVAQDLCSALDMCRQHHVVHRDIKPQNIFVSENGTFKLGDFGAAKIMEKTSGGTRIGTYKYIAPEVYHNKPYGAAADIYSLGLTLYWMLNERRMPFLPTPPASVTAAMDERARLRRLSGEKLPAPAHGIPALKEIVLKACEADTECRYSSAGEMLDDLKHLTWGQEIGKKTMDPIPVSDRAQDCRMVEPKPAEVRDTASFAKERVEPHEEIKNQAREPQSPLRTNPVNTGFSSANDMLEALGLSALKSQLPERKQQAAIPPVNRQETQQPKPAARNTGFGSADEMMAALGLGGNTVKSSAGVVLPQGRKTVSEPRKGSSYNGFSSANDMLEFLGIDSKTMKKK